MAHEDLTKSIIGAAIEGHRHLGPGLLESAYERCLCVELDHRAIRFESQKVLPGLVDGVVRVSTDLFPLWLEYA